MQRGHGLVLVVSALSLVGGCVVERSYEPVDTTERRRNTDVVERFDDGSGGVVIREPTPDGTIQEVGNGSLRGDIGPALGIDDDAPLTSFYDDGYFAAIETVTITDERAAMLMLTVSNPAAVFVPGRTSWSLADQGGETQVTVLGCTGAEVGYYDEFDVPADEVVVVVEETPEPGEVVVQVHAAWTSAYPGETREATSQFRMTR